MPRVKSFNKRKKSKLSCSLEKEKIEKSIALDDPKSSCSRIDVEVVEIDSEPKIKELSRNKEENSHPSDLHEFSFISQEEYDSINSHELEIENVNPVPTLISGHRIVDLQYVLNWALRLQGEHSKIYTLSRLEVVDEVHAGLTSLIVFQCVACGHRIEKSTENPDNDKSEINYGAVWGTLSTGSTYQHLKDFLGIMDIPCMSYRCFHSIEIELGDQWKSSLWMSMEKAGKEEKRLATELGQVDSDGLPWTIVYCDGGWSHRSYGHSYYASSGVAVIIGKLTKKILFLGVRNKYCSVCSRYDHKQQTPPNHICYKNWHGSSGAMEASIIAEGFQQSISMHGLKYLQFVADGDSSVYSKIRSEVSYGADVTKIECRNHAIKNYGKALYKIKSDSTLNIEARKLLTTTIIKQLQDICTKIIYINACGDVEKLKINLENSISHVFEDHSNCDESYCTEVRVIKNETMKNVRSTGLFYHLNSCLQRIIAKGHRLINNETSNRAELYMSILCKFNAGKRLNLTGRGNFQCRSMLSGLRYNEGLAWQENEWKNMFKRSPGKNFRKIIEENKKVLESSSKRRLEFDKNSHPKKKIKPAKKDTDYGPDATQPQLNETEYESERKRVLRHLEVKESIIGEIEKKTIGQWDNSFYRDIRKNRLTASQFGTIYKRRLLTTCDKLEKSLVTPHSFDNSYTIYGKQKEDVARQKFIECYPNKTVRNSGIFIHPHYNHLAATPDGIVDENGLLEIKCLLKVHNSGKSLLEAAQSLKNLPVEVVGGKLQLKNSHNYYYQVQGQLNIANKDICYFVIYINDAQPLYVEEIKRDEQLWKLMVDKLNTFYFNCYLPRLIDKNRICYDANHNK